MRRVICNQCGKNISSGLIELNGVAADSGICLGPSGWKLDFCCLDCMVKWLNYNVEQFKKLTK